MNRIPAWHLSLVIASLLAVSVLTACNAADQGPLEGEGQKTSAAPPMVATASPTERAHRPQVTATPYQYGPDSQDFPAGINPMTGLPVLDAELLKVPAVLVSISHFPPEARPQAGLSFAPFVYEFSITGGETRFLTAFYGEFPRAEELLEGPCKVRTGAFHQTGTMLGNRVWLDANANGLQDQGESGLAGICVNLLDRDRDVRRATTTDSNGIYGFSVEAGSTYEVEFELPKGMQFTARDIGDEALDSDVDPGEGTTVQIPVTTDSLDWDAGVIPAVGASIPTADPDLLPAAEVGPVRSGRLLYAYLAASYSNSCLIYAFADPTILAKLPHCAFVSHETSKGGQMISIDRMRSVAEDNMRHAASRPFDYSSNLYAETAPEGGVPGTKLNVSFGNINQSGWIYDPLYGSYLRYVDTADPASAGVLHPEVDRLTGRQLHFENVVVIMVDTEVVTRTNLDIHLDVGNEGPALLFRDGQQYTVEWSTRGGDYEHRTGLRKPIRFLNMDGSPAALKPGHTWVTIVTPFSTVESQGQGIFQVRYAPPAGEAQ